MTDLKSALEAVLFAAGDPVPIGRLSLAFAAPPEEIESAAVLLAEESEKRGIQIEENLLWRINPVHDFPKLHQYIRELLQCGFIHPVIETGQCWLRSKTFFFQCRGNHRLIGKLIRAIILIV